VLDGLAALSAADIVHGDVKPANVFLTPDGRFKLGDFGAARAGAAVETETIASLAQPAPLPGTLRYAAPEVLEGRRPTPRSDLYAAALTFAEAITGRKAAAPGAPDDPRKGPEALLAELPPAWHKGLSAALSPRPAERPADAAALLATLRAAWAEPTSAGRPRAASARPRGP